MSSSLATDDLLRDDLLAGVSIALMGAPGGGPTPASAVAARCTQLGAVVSSFELAAGRDGPDDAAAEEQLGAALERAGELDVAIIDGAGIFASATAQAAGAGATPEEAARLQVPLGACLEACWSATHAVVNRCFLPRGRGGRIVYLAPAPAFAGADGGEHREAARAGLENLARTLSIEWARHAITLVAIAPGHDSSGEDLAALCAYLASPAGSYFSGCLLDLCGPRG